ncbi:MAG: hypothetical protein ABSG40_15880, partial [Terriglobales bacterium]
VAFACPATDRRCWRAPYILFPSPHASSLLTNFQQFYHGLLAMLWEAQSTPWRSLAANGCG